MHLINFQLRAVAIVEKGENNGFVGGEVDIILSVGREYNLDSKSEDDVDDRKVPILVVKNGDLTGCIEESECVQFEEGDPDHTLMNELIEFMNRWCLDNITFG